MAGRTTGGDASVVHRGATFEAGGGFVAGFAGRSGGDVGTGFGFDVGKAAAVTGRTAAGDASVVHHRAFKTGRALMACVTRCRGRYMTSTHS